MQPSQHYEFPVERRLRDKSHFQAVFKSGRWNHTLYYQVISSPAKTEFGKIAVASPKKIGKAHDRNRCKRRVKEAIRLLLADAPPQTDLIFLTKPIVLTAEFSHIVDAVKATFSKLNK
ncbi:MAG: ribonuclease P protein component [bacterium]|nr:ribonuclease P protein component [bacterium]